MGRRRWRAACNWVVVCFHLTCPAGAGASATGQEFCSVFTHWVFNVLFPQWLVTKGILYKNRLQAQDTPCQYVADSTNDFTAKIDFLRFLRPTRAHQHDEPTNFSRYKFLPLYLLSTYPASTLSQTKPEHTSSLRRLDGKKGNKCMLEDNLRHDKCYEEK